MLGSGYRTYRDAETGVDVEAEDDRELDDEINELEEGTEAYSTPIEISGNGRSVRTTAGELQRMANGGARQVSMFKEFPDLDEHVGLAEKKVQEFAEALIAKSGLTAAMNAGFKVATQFSTSDDVLMDCLIEVSVKAKPAKVKE
jgi:hypothetical protein